MSRKTTAAFLAALMLGAVSPLSMRAQQSQNEDFIRRAKTKVQPIYPDLARKMNITGTVKVEIVVLPNGSVKDARVVGGHPVLAQAAIDAAKKWHFDAASGESTGVIEFKFDPH